MKLVQLQINNKLVRPSARAVLTYINPLLVDFTFEVKRYNVLNS